KMDHYFSPTTTLAASYSFDNTTVNAPDSYNLKTSDSPSDKYNILLNLQHLFSPNLINNTRVGVSRNFQASSLDASSNPVLNDASLGFLPGKPMGSMIIVGVSGIPSGVGAGVGTDGRAIFGYAAPQAEDDLSWTKGRHSIRTGFRFERIDYNMNLQMIPNG